MTEYDIRLIEVGQKEERKAIADWFRKQGYQQIAYAIERGDHREAR